MILKVNDYKTIFIRAKARVFFVNLGIHLEHVFIKRFPDIHCHTDQRTSGVDKVARRKLIIASILCVLFMIAEVGEKYVVSLMNSCCLILKHVFSIMINTCFNLLNTTLFQGNWRIYGQFPCYRHRRGSFAD